MVTDPQLKELRTLRGFSLAAGEIYAMALINAEELILAMTKP
jgi:hypothetical protein